MLGRKSGREGSLIRSRPLCPFPLVREGEAAQRPLPLQLSVPTARFPRRCPVLEVSSLLRVPPDGVRTGAAPLPSPALMPHSDLGGTEGLLTAELGRGAVLPQQLQPRLTQPRPKPSLKPHSQGCQGFAPPHWVFTLS